MPTLDWSAWSNLAGVWRGAAVPNVPGLYRVRRVGSNTIDYIGQTGGGGMTLRCRMAVLAGVYGAEMPYRDPHTAGPALWALLQIGRKEFEVSVVPVEGSNAWRRALEALTIALYRQDFGGSPTVNFGRMPSGYREAATGMGLYRLRRPRESILVYVGEGSIRDRVARHVTVGRQSQHRQTPFLGDGESLECSWIVNSAWARHHRLELETDLIGAHVLVTGQVPAAQFLG